MKFFFPELTAKRLGLHELVPKATRIVVLVNPANALSTESKLRDAQTHVCASSSPASAAWRLVGWSRTRYFHFLLSESNRLGHSPRTLGACYSSHGGHMNIGLRRRATPRRRNRATNPSCVRAPLAGRGHTVRLIL